jgi:hypothetical protein
MLELIVNCNYQEAGTAALNWTYAILYSALWKVIPRLSWRMQYSGSCKNRHFGGTCRLHHEGDIVGELGTTLAATSNRSTLDFFRSFLQLLVTTNAVPGSPIHVTLMMEAMLFSETSVLTRATLRNIREDGILHSHRRGNLRFYTIIVFYLRLSVWIV